MNLGRGYIGGRSVRSVIYGPFSIFYLIIKYKGGWGVFEIRMGRWGRKYIGDDGRVFFRDFGLFLGLFFSRIIRRRK